MSIEKMTSNIKILLDLEDSELNKIYILIRKTMSDIQLKYNIEDIPEKYESVIEDLVIYRLNTTIGATSENLGDRSISYTEDIPIDIQNRLRYLNKVRFY